MVLMGLCWKPLLWEPPLLSQQEEDGMNGAPLAGGVGVVATQPDLPDSVTDEMRTEVEKSDGRNGEHRG